MNEICACRIFGDCWNGTWSEDWHIAAASPEDLDRAVERLDAQKYTMVTIDGVGEQHMAIGGGSGRYVVYVTFDHEEFWNLLCSPPKEGKILLFVGGQEGEYPAKQVVDLEQARAAGRFFCRHRQLDPAQCWEKG